MTIIEEAVVGRVHGQPAAATLKSFLFEKWPETGSGTLLVALVLVPLVGMTELSKALGPGTLRDLMLRLPASPLRNATQHRS